MLRTNETDLPQSRYATRKHWPYLVVGLALAVMALAPEAAPQAAAARTTYRVVNLGTADLSELPAINANGQVAFSLNTPAGSRAWFYDGAALHDIGTLGGTGAFAAALNDAGQVAGYAGNASGFDHAFVWSAAAGMVDLGTLPDAANSRAAAINNRGVVVGTSEGIPLAPPHAFRWSAGGGMQDLGAFSTGFASFSSAMAINDAGLIAGFSSLDSGDRHAFVWTPEAGLADIDTLASIDSNPVDVGAQGQVAGNVFVSAIGDYHAYLWTAASGMRDLGAGGGVSSAVTAMSSGAQVVGVINLASGYQNAMSWTRAGGMVKLGTLGGPRSNALAVNNYGQVVGFADARNGKARAYVWSAQQGMLDLNKNLRRVPGGLVLDAAVAISDKGAIVATSNAGLVLLKPDAGTKGAPAVGPIAAGDLVQVGVPVEASVGFAAEDPAARHNVTWTWGDGSGERAGSTRATDGAGSASASYTYAAPGIYLVSAKVTDLGGNRATVSRRIVAYDRARGLVGGSGAFVSLPGAHRKDRVRAGRASFSFLAPAAANAKASGAGAALHFNVAGLGLRSRSLRTVAVQAGHGRFEGSGSINGKGDYKFALDATAGAAGAAARFGLKIWHADPATGAQVVDYENSAAPIAEGAIAL